MDLPIVGLLVLDVAVNAAILVVLVRSAALNKLSNQKTRSHEATWDSETIQHRDKVDTNHQAVLNAVSILLKQSEDSLRADIEESNMRLRAIERGEIFDLAERVYGERDPQAGEQGRPGEEGVGGRGGRGGQGGRGGRGEKGEKGDSGDQWVTPKGSPDRDPSGN